MRKETDGSKELSLLKKELEQYLRTAEKFNFLKEEIQKQIDLYLDNINQELKKLNKHEE